jgi:hypothetical protein
VPVLKAGVDDEVPETPALMKQRTFTGNGALAALDRSTLVVAESILTILVGLTTGARNIYYLTSGRYEP